MVHDTMYKNIWFELKTLVENSIYNYRIKISGYYHFTKRVPESVHSLDFVLGV